MASSAGIRLDNFGQTPHFTQKPSDIRIGPRKGGPKLATANHLSKFGEKFRRADDREPARPRTRDQFVRRSPPE
jgi:hypothetical protein